MEIQENLIGSAKTEESEYLNSQGKAAENAGEVPFRLFSSSRGQRQPSVDMNQVVGKMDILLVCLDTLRYDVAAKEEAQGTTPVLNRYGSWKKCQAPGNFTWPSHHAMFAGFLPADCDAKNLADREMLFFPKQIGMGKKAPRGAYGFSGGTIMEGLEKEGYDTWCVGGVSFFDKRSWKGISRIFPEKLLEPVFRLRGKGQHQKPGRLSIEKTGWGRPGAEYFHVPQCGCHPLSQLFLSGRRLL